jgi:hypothetical protein
MPTLDSELGYGGDENIDEAVLVTLSQGAASTQVLSGRLVKPKASLLSSAET